MDCTHVYLPSGKVVGLSKLASGERGGRPQAQERLTQTVADLIEGVCLLVELRFVVESTYSCMTM